MNFLISKIESSANALFTNMISGCISDRDVEMESDNETYASSSPAAISQMPANVAGEQRASSIPVPNADQLVIMPMNAPSDDDLPKNAVLYIRVSTVQQEFEAQKSSCIEYCTRRGLNIVGVYQEKTSGYKNATDTQPQLRKLLETEHDVCLVVFSIDRFSRNVDYCNGYIDLMEQNNITLRCVKETVNLATALGKHNFRSIVSLAQYESELIGERVRNNVAYKKKNGMHVGKAPYGSRVDRETRKLVIDKDEQAVIKFIVSNLGTSQKADGLSQRLFALMRKLGMDDPSNFVPLEAISEIKGVEYKSSVDRIKVNAETMKDILNDYNIQKRGRDWTRSSVSSTYKQFKQLKPKVADIDMSRLKI